MSNFIEKLFGLDRRTLKKYDRQARKVEALAETMRALSDDELRGKTKEFKDRLKKGQTLDDIKIEAFAVCREAAKRVLGLYPFHCQIIGGLVLNDGNVAEMRTGEGKTLTATMPVYLNALSGKGVHVVTVNEYLAQRDSNEMGQVYRWLGLTVGCNLHSLNTLEKKKVHLCDVTYTINSELGFDYLRDNMAPTVGQRVLRGLNFCIVDEADSVLIDESRTPLIISGGAKASASQYTVADRFVKMLTPSTPHDEEYKRKHPDYVPDGDFEIDVKTKACYLTDKGAIKAEKLFGVPNLYAPNLQDLVHRIHQALKANYIMTRDVEYLVDQNLEIQLIDQFTGRVLKGREYSDGLQQAIQAKEGVKIKEETVTLATITYQNFFRLFKKIGGMTGTAKTEEEEFQKIYNMRVICIPTNKPVIREDATDYIFAHKDGKIKAMVKEIAERHALGQPILIGTPSVEASEELAKYLDKANLKFEMLNAKNHAREAEIISHAGEKGRITLATNMAGRGTDIKLTEETRKLGGLCVFGLERHESRRIDNQLRGRSGRQGDPGFSQFCVSFEDDLMVRFGTDRAKNLLRSIGFNDDMSIRNKMLSASIESAQKRVEGNNYDTRKTILEYDNVINKQREIIYEKRNEILDSESIHNTVLNNFRGCVSWLVESHLMEDDTINDKDKEEILEFANQYLVKKPLDIIDLKDKTYEEMIDYIYDKVVYEYDKKLEKLPEDVTNEYEKAISLRVIDTYWTEHINTMALLRESIGLRGYAQESPVQAYTKEGYDLFDRLLNTIEQQTTVYLLNAEIRQNIERKKVNKNEKTNESDTTAKKQPKKVNKIGRNEPCPCGSGKKYKQCCGK